MKIPCHFKMFVDDTLIHSWDGYCEVEPLKDRTSVLGWTCITPTRALSPLEGKVVTIWMEGKEGPQKGIIVRDVTEVPVTKGRFVNYGCDAKELETYEGMHLCEYRGYAITQSFIRPEGMQYEASTKEGGPSLFASDWDGIVDAILDKLEESDSKDVP